MELKVLIVDDHEAARLGLVELITSSEAMAGHSVESGEDAVARLSEACFDAVVLDIRMPTQDGLATLHSIRQRHPSMPVVLVSGYDNPTYVARAAALGADDYVLKMSDGMRLREAVLQAAGRLPAPASTRLSQVREAMRREIDPRSLPSDLPLTAREAQVLRHIGLGLSNREIAQSLEISVETVKEHVQNILRKLDAKDRTDAAVRAVKLGLVDVAL